MEIKDHLHNFIVNNEDLERLEVELKRFNPFTVLKIQHYEIRHSNVLAWLLDPLANHNLGDRILKKIVMQVILQNEDVIPDELDLQKIQMGDFNDTVIFREDNNVDILVQSARNNLIVLIENKIYSKESKDQLKKYLESTRKTYPGYLILPVFLTLEGDGPIEQIEYCVYNYRSIYDIVQFIVELHKGSLAIGVYDFIHFYLHNLQGVLKMDDKISILCKNIYKQHKEALKTIYDVIKIDDTAFSPAIEKFVKDNPDIISTYPMVGGLWFLPKSISNVQKVAKTNWNLGYPIAFWFNKNEKKLGFIIEVGPFNNPEHRQKFLEHLESSGFVIKERSKKLESQYSRIYTQYVKVKDWSNEEEILDIMTDLYKIKAKSKVNLVVKSVQSFKWEKE